MPAPTGRLAARVQLERLGLEVMEQPAEQLEVVVVAQLAPVLDLDAPPGVVGDDRDAPIGARRIVQRRAQADRGVERLRALVEEIERPDVERAAREIDARGRRSTTCR